MFFSQLYQYLPNEFLYKCEGNIPSEFHFHLNSKLHPQASLHMFSHKRQSLYKVQMEVLTVLQLLHIERVLRI